MKKATAKRNFLVQASATTLMVPKVVALIPQIIGDKVEDVKENIAGFKQEVRDEVDARVNSVRHIKN